MFYVIEDVEHKNIRVIDLNNQKGNSIYKEWVQKNLIVFGRIDDDFSNCEVIGKIIKKFNSISELDLEGV